MKFFRKQRYKLFTNGNNISKYLKYAFGEILLVVIGILIALYINNMNEDAKEKKVLNQYLVKVKSHTQEDLKQLDTISNARRDFAKICKQARKAMLTHKEEENIYIMMASGVAFVDFYFKPKKDGYESLKNSSSFGKINNTPLDSLLIQYHNLVDLIKENESTYNNYIMRQESYLSTRFDRTLILAAAFMKPDSLIKLNIPQSSYNKVFKKYVASVAYRDVINIAAFQFDTLVEQYDELKEIGNEVVREIDVMIH